MPDITLCQNELCEKRKTCYRFIAPPSNYQSYFYFEDEAEKVKFAKDCACYRQIQIRITNPEAIRPCMELANDLCKGWGK